MTAGGVCGGAGSALDCAPSLRFASERIPRAGSKTSPRLAPVEQALRSATPARVGGGCRNRTGDLLIAKNIEEQPEKTDNEPRPGKLDEIG